MALRSVDARIVPLRILKTGQITLAASGIAQLVIPVTVAGSEALAFGAFSTNVTIGYWGDSTVLTTTGGELPASRTVMLKMNHVDTPVYIIGTIAAKFWWATLA